MRSALRSCRASIENRSEIHLPVLPIPFGDANDVTSILGVVPERLERLWGCPGTHLDGSWPLFAHPGRLWISLGASFGCPDAVPNASGGVPKTILDVQDNPRSIFHRFWHDLALISDDLRPIFHRFSVKPLATRPQNPRLEKESCDPRCPTWHLWCAVASCCLCVFRNGF